jgi:tripartite-type tricarboxylate transporter receptor subunit TctC
MRQARLLFSCLATIISLLGSAVLSAQGFPAKSISIVVPYPPGSTSDLIPRLLAPLLSQALAVPVLVENLAGANGALGAQKVEKGGTEELQILMAPTGVLAINQFLYTKLAYDPEKAFEPVVNLASTPNLIVVNKDVPAANLQELIQLAKNRPGSITYASAGIGSTSHLCGEMLRAFAQAPVVHVPYRGPAPAKLAVLGGEVSMICDNLSNVIQEVRNGRLKAIELTARSRHPNHRRARLARGRRRRLVQPGGAPGHAACSDQSSQQRIGQGDPNTTGTSETGRARTEHRRRQPGGVCAISQGGSGALETCGDGIGCQGRLIDRCGEPDSPQSAPIRRTRRKFASPLKFCSVLPSAFRTP